MFHKVINTIKSHISKDLMFFILISIVMMLGYLWFINSSYATSLNEYADDNFVLFCSVLIFIKFFGIVYPPISGGYFTLAAIPIIGWEYALICDLTGSILGGSVDYYIGRKYGIKIVKKFFGEKIADKIGLIKIKNGKEIEGLIVSRILAGATVVEAIHYAAGLFKIDFAKYTIAMLVSHLIIGLPVYWIFGGVLGTTLTLFMVPVLILALIILYKMRGRYLE